MPASQLRVGVNYAWRNYGWDFGEPPKGQGGGTWGPRAQWKETLEEDLELFRSLGIFCVRWFLLGDGLLYGIGEEAPRKEGASSWRFEDPPYLTPAFLEDYTDLLHTVSNAGMLLLPSLVDFHFAFPGQDAGCGSECVYIKGGRADVINDPSKQQLFFDRVLEPILAATLPFKESIYAFEIMNEPEWCTRGTFLGREVLNPHKTVDFDAMLEFLRGGIGRINRTGMRSTCGLCLPTLGRWDLGATLHQFHFYGDPEEVPPHAHDPRWPAIVGEFAGARHTPWSELGPAQTVYQRLSLLQRKGYGAAFVWAFTNQGDPAADFSLGVQNDIRRFVSG